MATVNSRRRRSPRRTIGAVLAIALVSGIGAAWVGPDLAERPDGAEIYERGFTDDGLPAVAGIYSPDGGLAEPSWRICADRCGPVVGRDEYFTPEHIPTGSQIELSTTFRGKTTTDRTPPWQGTVRNVKPPSFEGDVRVASTIRPRHGSWAGGWGDDDGLIGLRVCRTASGYDCRLMTASVHQPGNPEQALLGPRFEGWFVGAIEQRVGRNAFYTLEGHMVPSDPEHAERVPELGPTFAVGPLIGPIPPPAPEAYPTVAFAKRATPRYETQLDLGYVICPAGCSALVLVRQGDRVRGARRIQGTGRQPILTRLRSQVPGKGDVLVTVTFEDFGTHFSGRVRLPE